MQSAHRVRMLRTGLKRTHRAPIANLTNRKPDQLCNRHSLFQRLPDQRMGVERRRDFLHLWTSLGFSEWTGKDSSMTNLANFRISAVDSYGRRLAVASLAIPCTIVHARRAN